MNKIELDKNYNPKSFEDTLYAQWEGEGYFKPKANSKQPPFVMVIPPPNVTGVLHMGHGLNNALQDILARYYRMQGRPVLWLPGTDHAGIATQHVVEKELKNEGSSRQALGREEFIKKTQQVKERHHGIIVKQLKKLGSSLDWSREHFTLDADLSRAVSEVFVSLYQQGLIYRGHYLVNWCFSCHTALADDEVEYKEEQAYLYYINYKIEDSEQLLTIATTRPETLFGDVALAVHPTDERYKHLIGKQAILPLVGRKLTIIADGVVDKEYGTAVDKVPPAHDANDNAMGQRHNLASINILDEAGNLNSNTPYDYQGLSVGEARIKVVTKLEEAGFLIKKVALNHRVGHCYRCNSTIENVLSRQWFVKMSEMANKALEALNKEQIHFYPERYANTYKSWLNGIRDWCISRQLWWGHRIPAWYCLCGELVVSTTSPSSCPKCGGTNFKQDEDVLDTWFSSWLWPFSTMGWPNKTEDLASYYPTTTLVTAYDIIFFWVARMVMAGLQFTGKVPFSDIYITPLVRDKEGRKMSKSLGNGLDPLAIIDSYGADALKFTLAYLSSQSGDVNIDSESFAFGSRFCNKIWNASRYLLMNIDDNSKLMVNPTLSLLDNWLYARLNNTVKLLEKSFTEYRFDDMAHAVYDYFWNDFCDWYIEGSKLSLYSDDKEEKNRALSVALNMLEESLRLLHPFVPFVSEEIFQKLPNECKKGEKMLITAPYPQYMAERENINVLSQFDELQKIIIATRTLRSEHKISPEKKIRMALSFSKDYINANFIKSFSNFIKQLTKASQLDFITSANETEGAVNLAVGSVTLFIFVRDLVDARAEQIRLAKEIEKNRIIIIGCEAKLANIGFTNKAPQQAIEKEREKLASAQLTLSKLENYAASLK
jgi:valyl-tRNA synthetase